MGYMNWINLAQDRNQRRALANNVNFGFHKMLGNS
jgi:hypothetical protein